MGRGSAHVAQLGPGITPKVMLRLRSRQRPTRVTLGVNRKGPGLQPAELVVGVHPDGWR